MILYRIFAIAVFFSCLSSATAFALSPSEQRDLLEEAEAFFKEAQSATSDELARKSYEKSLMRYERLIEEASVANAGIYYNVGNCHFRMGDIGRAILNYKRALSYDALDENLRQNLAYARSKRLDRVEKKVEEKVLKTVLFWHYDLSFALRADIFSFSYVVFWVLLSVYLFRSFYALRYALFCSAISSLAFAASIFGELYFTPLNEGVVVADEVIARKGDGESYRPSFEKALHVGTEFSLIESRSNWHMVELDDGRRCWLPDSAVGFVF